MREIKFRVWDNVDYMTSFTLQDLQNKKIQFTSDCPIMQYTGLKDKNGKEIYEGDIIKIYCGSRDDIFQVGTIQYEAKYQGFYTSGCTIERYLMYDVEVIGNIYENSELIKTPSI